MVRRERLSGGRKGGGLGYGCCKLVLVLARISAALGHFVLNWTDIGFLFSQLPEPSVVGEGYPWARSSLFSAKQSGVGLRLRGCALLAHLFAFAFLGRRVG